MSNCISQTKPTIRVARKTDLLAILRLYAQPAVDDGKILTLSDAEALKEGSKHRGQAYRIEFDHRQADAVSHAEECHR